MEYVKSFFDDKIDNMFNFVYQIIAVTLSAILYVLSLAVWAIAWIFNLAIEISILKFKALADLTFVTESWIIMRDLANIAFIFILLYIAISTILRINSQDAKKMLSYVIIVALLVNFSAVFTRVAIDVSNVVAVTFYNRIDGEKKNGRTDVATAIMQIVGSSENIVGEGGATLGEKPQGVASIDNANASTIGKIIGKTIGSIILMILIVFVMLATTILFIIRTLVLLFLIIVAPVAFLGFAMPTLGKRLSGPWLKELTSNLLFAPAFMILFFITMKIADNRNVIQALGGTEGDIPKWAADIMVYIFVIGFLMASIIVAKQLGAHGGAGAEKFAFKGLKLGGAFAGGATLGATARLGQSTIGKGTRALTNTQTFKNNVGKSRLATAGFKKIGDSSFDIRKTKAAKGSGVSSYLGSGVATADERKNAKLKKEKEHATYLAAGDTNLEETKAKETEKENKEKKKSALSKRANNTKEEINELEREMSALEQGIPELENEIRSIENQQNFETDPQKHSELQKEIDNKKTQINKAKDRIREIPTEKSTKQQVISTLEKEQNIIQSEIDNIQQEISQLPQSRTDKYAARIEKSPGTTTGAKIRHGVGLPIRLMAIRNNEDRQKHAEEVRRYARQNSEERKKGDSEEAWKAKLEKLVQNLDKDKEEEK